MKAIIYLSNQILSREELFDLKAARVIKRNRCTTPEKTSKRSMPTKNCKCHTPPILYSDYASQKFIGIDETNKRFGEVNIEKCKICGSLWLVYFVEYVFFSKTGRWYRGLINQEEIKSMTPEKSVAFLESLDWYLYGGSYFDTTGKKGSGKVFVDFLSTKA